MEHGSELGQLLLHVWLNRREAFPVQRNCWAFLEPLKFLLMTGRGMLPQVKGRVVFLEDVLKQAIEKTKETVLSKNPNAKNVDQIAKQVCTFCARLVSTIEISYPSVHLP